MDALKRIWRMFLNLFIRKKNETMTEHVQDIKKDNEVQEFRVLSCDVVSIIEIEETN